jgi:hypothetical protein
VKDHGVSNAWASLASLLIGFIGIIAGSYLGAPEDPARMRRVFGYLQVPVGDEHLLPEAESE